MNKIDFGDNENLKRVMEYENEILELIDNQDEFTRSDLQGAAMAVVMKIMRETIEHPPHTKIVH
jgi:hypothetical protein